jgi:hypothetical protein
MNDLPIRELLTAKIEPHSGVAFCPDTQDSISKLEESVGALPAAMKAVLTTYGPAGFTGSASVSSDAGRVRAIFTLFGVAEIERDLRRHSYFHEFGLLPIADDEFNDRFVLCRDGSVQFVEFENGQFSLHRVAPSFDEFLGRIEVSAD